MKFRFASLLLLASFATTAFAGEPVPDRTWSFDSGDSTSLSRRDGSAAGVRDRCLVLSGTTLFEAGTSAALPESGKPFTLVVWFNPYNLVRGQQIVAAKNRYALNEREWGVMVDRDGKLRLYVHQGGWKTVHADANLTPGNWHQAGVVMKADKVELWLNGEFAGAVELSRPLSATEAPLTFGGVDDGEGLVQQTFQGALDEAALFDRPLDASEMAALYEPAKTSHPIPDFARPFPLWSGARPLPVAADIPDVKDVEFRVIKKWDRGADGYTFLHGVGLGWHKGKLYASIGHNKGAENTVTEEAQYRVSEDGGKTWGELRVIDAGDEPNLAVSHGVFVSHNDKLWAFHGAYYGKMKDIHARAYTLDEKSGEWEPQGVVVRNGFWPLNQPVKMQDGNWIMAGISAGVYGAGLFPAAVAISYGDDFSKWDYVEIPVGEGLGQVWGESAIWTDGNRVFNVARFGGQASALVAVSDDYGRTWSPSRISDLPMASSKPAAGTLSTGQRYLVCTTAANNGHRRTPLTIVVSRPGENVFCKAFVIRRSRHDDRPGESAESLSLSYPCAIEHDGKLYVGYSNDGGRRGNHNSAELAIIPVERLQAD